MILPERPKIHGCSVLFAKKLNDSVSLLLFLEYLLGLPNIDLFEQKLHLYCDSGLSLSFILFSTPPLVKLNMNKNNKQIRIIDVFMLVRFTYLIFIFQSEYLKNKSFIIY